MLNVFIRGDHLLTAIKNDVEDQAGSGVYIFMLKGAGGWREIEKCSPTPLGVTTLLL